ncbi:hypothetical protein KSS87_015716 [Heliosperma pusillum]|nr:hypothetical protein KSS87_015716 [Heliosperma pusillum]
MFACCLAQGFLPVLGCVCSSISCVKLWELSGIHILVFVLSLRVILCQFIQRPYNINALLCFITHCLHCNSLGQQ